MAARSRVLAPWRRYREIAAVLVRYGIGDTVSTLGMARWLAPWTHHEPATRARRLRLALAELGPTFVKFGQALSTRGELLPPELIAELEHLQDDVPALEPGQAEAAIGRALGEPVESLFLEFEARPLAAASIAQVHRAVLPTGERVAIKVRRPGIERIVEDDLAALFRIADWAERHIADAELYSPKELVEQFARTIRAELDLSREGHLIERFAANAAGNPAIRFPKVHWPYSTQAVLTMEYLDGAKLHARADWPADADPVVLAERGADVLLKQILVDGLFHADLHPGNILVFPGNVIGLLDFGIVGRLDEPTRDHLAELVVALARHDATAAVERLLTVTEPRGEVRMGLLRSDVAELIDAYTELALSDVPLGEVLHRVQALISAHRLRLPVNLALLIKALLTIEGVGAGLDPSFKMLEHAAPAAMQVCDARLSPDALVHRATNAGRDAVALLRTLPASAGAVLKQLRTGELQVGLSHRNLEGVGDEIARASIRIGSGIVLAGILVAGALLTTGAPGVPTAWWSGKAFVIAIVTLGLLSLLGLHRTRR